jgi:SnoaL-like protein
MTWKSLLSGAVGVLAGVFALAVVQAWQKGSETAGRLTVQDRLEIQELLHRYMFILDSCDNHNNGYDYADLYTPDGTFTNQAHGREALAKAAGRTSDGKCSPIRLRGAMNQVHLNIGEIIEPTSDGAKGISYLLMIDGPANEIYWNGWYEDVYARTPQGWRFKSRNHVGGAKVGVDSQLASARALWEDEPTSAGSRTLLSRVQSSQQPMARDPLKWLAER